MEVRCGNCRKLFHVSDDKIRGKGIKFACTRCGEYVKITMDNFSDYARSRAAVSAPDISGQKHTSTVPEVEVKATHVAEAQSSPESISPDLSALHPPHEPSKEPEFPGSSAAGFAQGSETPVAPDLSHLEELSFQIEGHPADDSGVPSGFDVLHERPDREQAEPEQHPALQPVMETEPARTVAAPDLESGLDMVSETEADVSSQLETGIAKAREAALAQQETSPAFQPRLEGEPAAADEPEPVVTMSTEATEAVPLESEKSPVYHPETAAQETGALGPEAVIASASAAGEAEQRDQTQGNQPEPSVIAAAKPIAEPQPILQSEPAEKPEAGQALPQQKTFKPETEQRPADRPKQDVTPTSPGALKKESARRPASSYQATAAAPAESPRSGSKAFIIAVAAILLALGSIGAFLYLRFPGIPGISTTESAGQMTSTQGLRVVNASGSLESNGDLLITGFVENMTEKPQPSWLVAVNVYDAKGTVIYKLRLLNGKQMYTRSDYDILEKRGVQIQEMKAKAIQEQGTVIPPKDKVPFEVRYFQPPAGIASFDAVLQPFNPARLTKEAQEQAN